MVGNLVLANAMVKADVRMAFVNVTHSSADKIALKVSKKCTRYDVGKREIRETII